MISLTWLSDTNRPVSANEYTNNILTSSVLGVDFKYKKRFDVSHNSNNFGSHSHYIENVKARNRGGLSFASYDQ